MKHIIITILSVFLSAGLMAAIPQDAPGREPKPVRFTVLDSSGEPVPNALIEASKVGPGKLEARTDKEGQAVLDLAKGASLSVYVSQSGYYQTGGELWRGGLYKGDDGRLVAREMPDSFTIELKAVRDPVDMSHLLFRGNAPRSDEPVGFDFKAGDWMSPFGKGKTPDILFRFHDLHVEEEAFAGTMTISFPKEGDGIQAFEAARPFSREFGSNLAPPHQAPVDGYEPVLSYSKAHREGETFQSYEKSQRNYIVRSRTVLDARGRILQACYGWILGEIEFDPRDPKGPQLSFAYYFNADPSPDQRSLEYNRYVPRELD